VRSVHLETLVASPPPEHPWQVFQRGFKTVAPLLLGIFPFALIAGSVAATKGLSLPAAMGFSVFIFAGASQLAALELMGKNASILVVVFTVAMVNLRFMIYSATIAPEFKTLSTPWKWLAGYLLTDQAFVLSNAEFEKRPGWGFRHWYFLGVGTGLWAAWQSGSLVGILLGAKLPASWSLEFAVPLSFLALLVPNIKSKATFMAGMASCGAIWLFAGLPHNLGLVIAILAGIFTGVLFENKAGV